MEGTAMYGLLADLVVVIHLAFVIFAGIGGVVVWRLPWIAFLHLPAVAWGVVIEWSGATCPLTPLESLLRQRDGVVSYGSGFIERYLLPGLYPAGLTRQIQIGLGVALLVFNLLIYCRWLFGSGWLDSIRWQRR